MKKRPFFHNRIEKKRTGLQGKVLANNKGMTLVEMVVAFAILALFMVAAARIISYTAGIYYAARGTSYGLEVSNMIANKVTGQLENAGENNTFMVKDNLRNDVVHSSPTILQGTRDSNGNRLDEIKYVDATGSVVSISVGKIAGQKNQDAQYLILHYDQTVNYGNTQYGEDPGYAAVDWTFDEKAYMGYSVSNLIFEPAGPGYPDNVIHMRMILHSEKYGDYESSYYIKCFKHDEIFTYNK